MGTVSANIDVDVPVRTAYNQWTQFESFPEFMGNVEKVEQVTDETLRWTTDIWGQERTFTARITEQEPDQRIAWEADGEVHHGGVVTFHRKDDNETMVSLELELDPDDFLEKTGDALGIVDRQTKKDLEHFKEFIESRGRETGAWRGEIEQDKLG